MPASSEAADVEGATWRALVEAWLEAYGTEPVTAKMLAVLPVVAESFSFKATTFDGVKKEFGHRLAAQRDRWYSDVKIADAGLNRTKVQTYRLVHRDGQPRKGTPPEPAADQFRPFGDDAVIDLTQRRTAR